MESFEVSGVTVKVEQELEPSNPREWGNLGHMVCWHRRSDLGDETVDTSRYDSIEELVESFDARVVMPLFLYEHSGMTMQTTPFGDPWDSGQVGFIYATAESIREAFGVKRISAKIEEQVRERLVSEVAVYDQYLTGDVYCYVIIGPDGETLDSLGDIYGHDYALEEAKLAAEREAAQLGRPVLSEQGSGAALPHPQISAGGISTEL